MQSYPISIYFNCVDEIYVSDDDEEKEDIKDARKTSNYADAYREAFRLIKAYLLENKNQIKEGYGISLYRIDYVQYENSTEDSGYISCDILTNSNQDISVIIEMLDAMLAQFETSSTFDIDDSDAEYIINLYYDHADTDIEDQDSVSINPGDEQ